MNSKKDNGEECVVRRGGKCYNMRLDWWAMVGTLEFILSMMGAYPKAQACGKLWGLQSSRRSLEWLG